MQQSASVIRKTFDPSHQWRVDSPSAGSQCTAPTQSPPSRGSATEDEQRFHCTEHVNNALYDVTISPAFAVTTVGALRRTMMFRHIPLLQCVQFTTICHRSVSTAKGVMTQEQTNKQPNKKASCRVGNHTALTPWLNAEYNHMTKNRHTRRYTATDETRISAHEVYDADSPADFQIPT